MKKLILFLSLIFSFSICYSQNEVSIDDMILNVPQSVEKDTTWKYLYKDNKKEFEFKIEKNYFCIKVNDGSFDAKNGQKLMLSTDEGYVNLEYKMSIKNGDYTILKYVITEKQKLIKYVISDIILNTSGKTYYMKIDTLTSNQINKLIR